MKYTDYWAFSEQYIAQMRKTHNAVVGLSQEVTDVLTNGILSGRIHDELSIYRGYVDQAAQFIEEVQNTMEKLLAYYLDDMNDAQCINGEYILYEKDYPDLRDYTQANFDKMVRTCDSTDYDANVFERISDWGENIVAGILKFLGQTFDWFSVRQTRYLVMEVNDITKRRLAEIQMRIEQREQRYANKAKDLYSAISELNHYLCTLQEMIRWNNGEFSASSFSQKMTEIYNGMESRLQKVDVDPVVTQGDVEAFVNLGFPEKFFDDSSNEIYDYLAEMAQMDWGDWDTYSMLLTQMFDIASKRLKEVFTGYTYDQFVIDKEMLDLLDEMAERETLYEGTPKETFVSRLQAMMGLVEKYGNKWGDHLNTLRDKNGNLLLDKRTKEYKAFKAFFDQFGSAEKILDYGGDLIQLIAKYIADYEKCEQILITLKDKCADDPDLIASLERIQKIYDRSFEAIAKDCAEKGFDRLIGMVEGGIDKMTKSSVFKVVGWVEMGIDIAGNVTGESRESEARMQLLATGYTQLNSARRAYEKALVEIKKFDPNAEGYKECLGEFEHCFEYYRVTQKRLYEQMGKVERGVRGEYFRYCAEELSDLSLDNFEEFKLLSLEEYEKLGA